METLKRHAFLLILGGLFLAGAIALGASAWAVSSDRSGLEGRLSSTERKLSAMADEQIPSQADVDAVVERTEQLRQTYQDIVEEVRRMGAARKPLVEGLFPFSPDVNLRLRFKQAYLEQINAFMKSLNAVSPELPVTDATIEAQEALRRKLQAATMMAVPSRSFFIPAWVGQPEPPSINECIWGQEDIWLMGDLVRRIREVNAQVPDARIPTAPVKDLIAISIGNSEVGLDGRGGTGRYRGLGRSSAPATLTGLASQDGFYLVLPWKLDVIVDADYVLELVRRLEDTESFLKVEGWRVRQLTDASMARVGRGVNALTRDAYGPRGVVRLEVVGVSLVFQLKNGRVTTVEGQTSEGTPVETGPGELIEDQM